MQNLFIMKQIAAIFIVLLVFITIGCEKSPIDNGDDNNGTINSIKDLKIPKDFSFKTTKKVHIQFSDFKAKPSNLIRYDIYIYDDQVTNQSVTYNDETGQSVTQNLPISNVLNNKIATKITNQTSFVLDFTLPQYVNKLYVVRNEMGQFSSAIVTVNGTKARYDRTVYQGNYKLTDDVLYGVNGGGDLFSIDHTTGSMTVLSSLPNNTGSYTCAINPINKKLYTIGHNKKLYCYDIAGASWTTVGNVGHSGPRLGYNRNNGFLYFSTSNKVYKVDPSNANITATYYLTGMQSYSGGDVTFDASGTMYISSTAGLYKCTFGSNNIISTTWISSQSLPNYPNSLTFDSNDQLWWATVAYSSGAYRGRVFIMDKVTGGWQDKFTPYTTYIHDLATLPYDSAAVPSTDTDNDGIIDFYDEYPNNPNVAATTYTPSIYGWGTYAFEDLWPYQGDYDFNDLVINYRYINMENAAGNVVETRMKFKIKNVGGSLRNGFGIQIDMPASKISAVTGSRINGNYVTLGTNGLEVNQSKPVIIPFDNAWDNYTGVLENDTLEVVIKYSSAIDPDSIGEFNPFIMIDETRGREVHLSDFPPTDLVNTSLLGTNEDNSIPAQGRYYKNASNLPWGIDIIHDFVVPKEKKEIILGYPKFASWAQSGGTTYSDWYKELPGYRNTTYLKN